MSTAVSAVTRSCQFLGPAFAIMKSTAATPTPASLPPSPNTLAVAAVLPAVLRCRTAALYGGPPAHAAGSGGQSECSPHGVAAAGGVRSFGPIMGALQRAGAVRAVATGGASCAAAHRPTQARPVTRS